MGNKNSGKKKEGVTKTTPLLNKSTSSTHASTKKDTQKYVPPQIQQVQQSTPPNHYVNHDSEYFKLSYHHHRQLEYDMWRKRWAYFDKTYSKTQKFAKLDKGKGNYSQSDLDRVLDSLQYIDHTGKNFYPHMVYIVKADKTWKNTNPVQKQEEAKTYWSQHTWKKGDRIRIINAGVVKNDGETKEEYNESGKTTSLDETVYLANFVYPWFEEGGGGEEVRFDKEDNDQRPIYPIRFNNLEPAINFLKGNNKFDQENHGGRKTKHRKTKRRKTKKKPKRKSKRKSKKRRKTKKRRKSSRK